MLNQLKRVSRRITAAVRGEKVGGLMATGKSTKGSAKNKTVARPKLVKAPLKVAKPAKASAKPSKNIKPSVKKSTAGVAKTVAKAIKVPPKPAPQPVKKVAKSAAKSVEKKVAVKAVTNLTAKSARPAKVEQPAETFVSAEDFAGAEAFAADIASDMEAAELETAEALTPSAALLAAMKPTISDEKAAEKKKKKDDLKLDRGGDLEAQWQVLKEKNKAIKPVNYKMSESFEARTPMLHKVLGWGFIITNQNDRLEVLFQQGIKFLISNYKA